MFSSLISEFFSNSKTEADQMTSTDPTDTAPDEVRRKSTAPVVQPEQPSRSYSYSYSSAASRGTYPTSPLFTQVTTAPSNLRDPVPPLCPQFAPLKPDKERRRFGLDSNSEVTSLKARNEKLGEIIDRLRCEAGRLQKERDSRRDHVRGLRDDYDELEKKHASIRQKLFQVTRSHEQALQQVTSLERKYEEMETLKNDSETALAEVRQFVSTSDPGDGNFLLLKLNDFNALIDDLAFNVSMELADPGQTLRLDQLLHLVHYLPYQLIPMACQAASVANPRTPTFDDIAIGYTRAGLHSFITSTVWETFCWSLGQDQDQVIRSVYRTLRDVEPQALHARWRSLTYQTLLRTESTNDSASSRAAQHYQALLPLYDHILSLTGRKTSSQAASNCVVSIEKVVTSAFEIQKLFRQDYLSANYNILTPAPAAPFDSKTMERAEGPKESHLSSGGQVELVVACVGAGLTRTTQEFDGEGKKVLQTLIVKKAEVLTTCWFERRDENGGKMACD